MSGNHINYMPEISDDKIQITDRTSNAVVDISAHTFGWFKIEYDETNEKIRVRFYENYDDAEGEFKAESSEIAVSSLPATVTLTGDITASIYINGVS